jgi:DNA-directed RNA polymerase subunit RPC12/RpoP
MALIKCTECGKEISDKAGACPQCGSPVKTGIVSEKPKKKKMGIGKWVLIFLAGIFIISFIKTLVTNEMSPPVQQADAEREKSKTTSTPVPPAIPVPQDQQAFVRGITSLINKYNEAPNELKKSSVRSERKKNIKETLNGKRSINNWVGVLAHMGTTSDQKAYITIRLEGGKIDIATWNNALSDIQDLTLIPESASLYKKVSDMKVGDRVIFNGSFLSSENDFIREASLTEAGSMLNPKFIIRFSEIKKP